MSEIKQSKTVVTPQQITVQIYTTEEPFTVFKYKFELITNLEEKCKQNESVDVVFMVVSFIKRFDRRTAIRQTWGLENRIKAAKIRRVFLMGTDPKNDSVRTEILRENEQHHDIVLADYADTYENNTIKYIMGINWARKFCSNSKFYVIADDDAFFSFLFYGGFLFSSATPMRDGKWKATLQQYPYDVYPKIDDVYLEKCKRNESVDVVFLIVSFIKTYDRRMAIRQTWGLENHIKDAKIRRVFLMGTDPKNDSVRTEILRENEQHHDIVLADYADTYENNTIKYIMGIEWARKFCSNSKFYVIADDDAFFSVKNLLKYLSERKLYDNQAKFQNIYLTTREQQHQKFLYYGGFLLHGATPMRDGKWKATLQQYPYDVYPKYITGHTVILSHDILDLLVEAAHHTKFFW
ncbi:hypothetical protein B566_EDAN006198 [Ephemera danica]|nr:hypothetical protein B566_EDAN006198 [Ephemera danica]